MNAIKLNMNFQYIICLLTLIIDIAISQNNPIVTTELGKIKGSFMTSRLNKKIYAFRGIKYAKAPIGSRRFKPPEPINPWTNIFDASVEAPSCIRMNGRKLSEDCLVLNVYTTQLPTESEPLLRPVIVFFHPGAFVSYSGQSYIYGPQYYLDQDIVLVTVNYRLLMLGFISTGDQHAPGNLGMKDQVEALRFIQKHIDKFGGDPNSVTITGYSVGGWSVVLHMLSPMSRGLFHKAIAMSLTTVEPQLLPYDQKHLVIKQARALKCPSNDLETMFACLRKKPAMNFAKTLPQLKEFYNDPSLIFSVVVEPEIPDVERFLPAQPLDIIRSKNYSHVPLVIGRNENEAIMNAFRGMEEAKNGNDSYFQDLDLEWSRVAPICFLYDRGTEHSRIVSDEIRKFYLNNESISLKNFKNLAKIYGDSSVGFPVHRIANLMATYNEQPVYYYSFVYQGRFSYLNYNNTKKPYGVVHYDDLMYIFYISYKFPMFGKTAPEISMVQKMTAMWANFAKTGEPIPKDNKLFENVIWEALTPTNNKYLEINNTFIMKNNLFADRYALWDRLLPLPSNSLSNSDDAPNSQINSNSVNELMSASEASDDSKELSSPRNFDKWISNFLKNNSNTNTTNFRISDGVKVKNRTSPFLNPEFTDTLLNYVSDSVSQILDIILGF